MSEQQDFFNEYYDSIKMYKWIGVKDLSEEFNVSERTIFKWLKEGKIEGVKWKNRRLINTISVMGFLLKKKCIEMEQIKKQEIRNKIEQGEFESLF